MRRWIVTAVLLGLAGAAAYLWYSLPDVRPLARTNPATTAFIELRRERARERGRAFRLRWNWRKLDQISPYLRHAVIHAEDARFWQHEGVDWQAVKQAAEHNWEARSLSRGASTITQQVAKNLYLSPSRNPLRKVREFLIARRLERHLTKRRLLEIYLNIAEWGDGVFGAEAAAQRWFDRSASELTPAQAARLAIALPSPRRFAPDRRTAALDRKALRLLREMRRDDLIDDAELERATTEVSGPHRTASR
jgi:monofunctional biosynthetic peptidoglycan transglycosylase